jgi:cell division transport system permease protein
MKKFYRNLTRVWKSGTTKSLRMLHIFLPLALFFSIVITFAGSFFFAFGTVNHLIKDFENKLNIVVYIDSRADQKQIDQITTDIQANADVKQIEFISQNQALEVFKERHKDDAITLEALAETGTNPFGASVVVFAKDPTKYAKLYEDFRKLNSKFTEGELKPIEDISYEKHKVAIDKFAKMLQKGEIIFAIILIIISIVLLFIVYIALRFATQGDRDEIKVMRLVGAPTMLMVGPTTVMGVLSGVLGAILSLLVLYFLAREISPYTLSFAGFNVLSWFIKNTQYFIIFTVSFGGIIGFFGSLLAIRRHL